MQAQCKPAPLPARTLWSVCDRHGHPVVRGGAADRAGPGRVARDPRAVGEAAGAERRPDVEQQDRAVGGLVTRKRC